MEEICTGMFASTALIVIIIFIIHMRNEERKRDDVEESNLPLYYKRMHEASVLECLVKRFTYGNTSNYDGKGHDKHHISNNQGGWIEWVTDDQGSIISILKDGCIGNNHGEKVWFERGELRLLYRENNVAKNVALFSLGMALGVVREGVKIGIDSFRDGGK